MVAWGDEVSKAEHTNSVTSAENNGWELIEVVNEEEVREKTTLPRQLECISAHKQKLLTLFLRFFVVVLDGHRSYS